MALLAASIIIFNKILISKGHPCGAGVKIVTSQSEDCGVESRRCPGATGHSLSVTITVYSGYIGHVFINSGHSDIVATFPGTKSIYSIIFRSDIVAIRI